MAQPNFSGTTGNAFTDIAGVGSRLIKESQADEEKKRAQALQDSLAKLQFDKFGYDQKHDADIAAASATEHGIDNKRADAQLLALTQDREARLAETQKQNGISDQLRGMMAGFAGERANRAQVVQIMGPDGKLHTKLVHPGTGVWNDVQLDDQGNPVTMGGGFMSPGAQPAPAAAPQEQPGAKSPGGAADHPATVPSVPEAAASAGNAGGPGKPKVITDAAGQAHTLTGEHASGTGGMATQSERDRSAAYGQLKSMYTDLTSQMAGVNYQPPGMATQFGLDMQKNGSKGLLGSAEKIGGNMAVGAFAPKYQTLDLAYNSLSTFLTQMITGAQMSQQEADRIRSLVAMRAGDTPTSVQFRLKQAQEIIDAAEAKVNPRAAPAAEPAGPTAPVAAVAPGGKKQYRMPDGTLVDLE